MALPSSYQPLVDEATGPLRDAPREVAEAWFHRLMAARPERRRQLAALWRHADVDADLDGAEAPSRLGAWLAPALTSAGADAMSSGGWQSVCADVALWLGDRAIAAAPTLRWDLYVAHKKATGYQRAVLIGFTRVDDARYYVDVAHMVAAWADLAARGRRARPDFLQTIETTILGDA